MTNAPARDCTGGRAHRSHRYQKGGLSRSAACLPPPSTTRSALAGLSQRRSCCRKEQRYCCAFRLVPHPPRLRWPPQNPEETCQSGLGSRYARPLSISTWAPVRSTLLIALLTVGARLGHCWGQLATSPAPRWQVSGMACTHATLVERGVSSSAYRTGKGKHASLCVPGGSPVLGGFLGRRSRMAAPEGTGGALRRSPRPAPAPPAAVAS
jgi:hypothetical protein